jgi:elongation factor G
MGAKEFATADIRNIVLAGHGGAGKTAIGEAMLFVTKATTRMGRTDDGTSTLDFEPEEHKRGGSIATAVAWVEYGGKKVNVIDTPGDQNFTFDALNAMRGADTAVIVLGAPDGFEPGAEVAFHEAVRLEIPRILVVSKMDRERANWERCLADFKEATGVKAVPLQVPIGSEHDFHGVVGLLSRKAYSYAKDGNGQATEGPIPAELEDEVNLAWASLVEEVASTDDALMEKYLETFELSEDEVKTALQIAFKKGQIVPALFASGPASIGVTGILDLVCWAAPNPLERAPLRAMNGDEEVLVNPDASGPFVAQVIHTTVDELQGKISIFRIFSGNVPTDPVVKNTVRDTSERMGAIVALHGKERTSVHPVSGDVLAVAKLKDTHTGDTLTDPEGTVVLPRLTYPDPMMAYVIHPATKGDEDKLKTALERLLEEDPTLSISHDELTSQLVLQGMGQSHLEMAIERMRRKYKVSVTTELPPVPYRETIKRRAENVEGKHKKQTGGAGQFGVCYLTVEPNERGAGFEFVDEIKGGAIPRQFIPSVEKGVLARMKSGPRGGYPITDVKVRLVDGKYHAVDSKDVAFQMAGSKGLKAAFEQAGTVLLEPFYELEVVVPSEAMGDVMGDINGRRGRVLGMDQRGTKTIVQAVAPLAEIQRYAPDLRAMTAGKGTFTMKFSTYEEVAPNMVEKVVAASPFKKHVHEADAE